MICISMKHSKNKNMLKPCPVVFNRFRSKALKFLNIGQNFGDILNLIQEREPHLDSHHQKRRACRHHLSWSWTVGAWRYAVTGGRTRKASSVCSIVSPQTQRPVLQAGTVG